MNGTSLREAISTEARRRRMEPIGDFTVPPTWGAAYAKLARPIPHCADFATVDLAADLMARFIGPALDGSATDKTWEHIRLAWC